MSDLSEFLLARIAEDKEAMRALLGYQHWADGQPPPNATTPMARVLDWTMTPARVLAKCAADRRIVELYQREADVTARTPASGPKTPQEARSGALGEACLLLALPYADHPDYREEWKP